MVIRNTIQLPDVLLEISSQLKNPSQLWPVQVFSRMLQKRNAVLNECDTWHFQHGQHALVVEQVGLYQKEAIDLPVNDQNWFQQLLHGGRQIRLASNKCHVQN